MSAPPSGLLAPGAGAETAAGQGVALARVPAAADVDLVTVVGDALDLRWQEQRSPSGLGLGDLAGLALRDNPRRAHLVVSRVLAKHLPVTGLLAEAAGHALGRQVAALLGPGRAEPPAAVLGYCETATALGQLVAEQLAGAEYVHTTRRPDPGVAALGGFEEEHSHATSHVLQPRDASTLRDGDRPLVLVDDELTTGTTVLNTVAALPRHARVVVATLLDMRPPAARAAFSQQAARLGVRIDVVAALDGALWLPPDLPVRAAELRAGLAQVPPPVVPDGDGEVVEHAASWPTGLPVTARTGLTEADRSAQCDAVDALARRLRPRLGERVLVLGTEELLRVPVRLAALLGDGAVVHSTTRSPVLAADLPGYAVRRALLFPAPDEPGRLSRLHGLPDAPYDDVVVLVDSPAPAARPLADALRPWARRAVHVVPL